MSQSTMRVVLAVSIIFICIAAAISLIESPIDERLQSERRTLEEINEALDEIERAMAKRLGMSHEEFQEWLDEHSKNSNTDGDPNEEGY